MKKTVLLLFSLTFISTLSQGQLWKLRRFDLVFTPGITHFFGDIGGYPTGKNLAGIKDISFMQLGAKAGIGTRYRVLERVALKAGVEIGYFHSSDDHGFYNLRGFESTTFFIEPEFNCELYLVRNKKENSYLFVKKVRDLKRPILSYIDLYIFSGIGGLAYNAIPNSKLFSFATDRTGFSPVIPVGIGIIRIYPDNFSLGIEAGARYSFVDELDDFAPSTSKANDIYMFLNITVYWRPFKTRHH